MLLCLSNTLALMPIEKAGPLGQATLKEMCIRIRSCDEGPQHFSPNPLSYEDDLPQCCAKTGLEIMESTCFSLKYREMFWEGRNRASHFPFTGHDTFQE